MTLESLALSLQVRIRLRDAARVKTGAVGTTWLVAPSQRTPLGHLDPAQLAALTALAHSFVHENDLMRRALAEGGAGGLRSVHTLLAALREGNWLLATLEHDGVAMLSVCPLGHRTEDVARSAPELLADVLAGGGLPGDGPLVLSRFALLRRDGDTVLLESPRSTYGVRLHRGSLLTMLGAIATPRRAEALPVPDGLDRGEAVAVIGVLIACGLVVAAGSAEETDFDLLQWSPHELWFHAQSRQGRVDAAWGATYWAKGRFDPLPALRKPRGGQTLRLFRPDLDAVAKRDPSLTAVLENRRSLRNHDQSAPLSAKQLGEFLYRTSRTRGTWAHGGVEMADRPYPSGGALHELELHLVVTDVADVPAGLYHYDGQAHQLERVSGDSALARQLASHAAAAAAATIPPQVLIVITARFGRVMWKYQSMAYALTLKNVGVLFSVMYCVATAMNLASCALGGGNADLFGRAAGLDPLSEASVGEFLLGSAPLVADAASRQAKE